MIVCLIAGAPYLSGNDLYSNTNKDGTRSPFSVRAIDRASHEACTNVSSKSDICTRRSLPLIFIFRRLQFAWFIGHVTLLTCTLRYGLSYITFHPSSRWARYSYRTAFVAAAATYGIVVFKGFRARQKSGKAQGSPVAMLADENVQYLSRLSPYHIYL